MALRIDPEKNEVRGLGRATDWRGKRVLEVGCGDGRLTRRLAELGAKVHAIDPDPERIRAARKALPQTLTKLVQFKPGSAERLSHPDASFDVVIFAWAL